MHIALAPFRLKAGVSEDMLVSTSDDFQKRFVQKQDGILKRILVKDTGGGYADIVYSRTSPRSTGLSNPSRIAKFAPHSSRSWRVTDHMTCTKY